MRHPVCGDAYSERGWGRELLDGRSGGVRDILNLRLGGRDGDVAGLSVVKFLEEVGGDDGVVSDEGGEVIAGRRRGVDGRVRVPGHSLAVEDAEGVPTEGGVGVAMLDDSEGLLGFSSPGFLLWRWLVGGVKVPRRGWQVPEEGWGVASIVALHLV